MERAAHQFEASLMQELFRPLEHDPLFQPEDEEEPGGSNGALTGFASETMARAISERGGFGIAKKIIAHFEEAGAGKRF